ncbi:MULTISPECIES: hypothetical protein [Streptomyces]|uniref:hypothetical protein n=1 Tax=Streptomyces TaxID=1883 RepID=UPI002E299DA5|nr:MULTISPECIES: hypothetical protein [Streptomyces]
MNSAPSLAPRRHRRRSTVVTAALTLPLLAVTACGTTTGTGTPGGTNPTTPPTAGTGTSGGTSGARDPSGTTAPEAPTTSTAGGTTTHVRAGVYFLHGEKVSPAPRTVTAPTTVTAAVRALLAGPDLSERAHGRATAIPRPERGCVPSSSGTTWPRSTSPAATTTKAAACRYGNASPRSCSP